MKAIIFGATGQDGSHLADLLLDKGYSVIGVARRCSVNMTERIRHLENHNNFPSESSDHSWSLKKVNNICFFCSLVTVISFINYG